MKISKIFVLFNLIILSLSISASEIYQCKNSEGKVAYSDNPCAMGESQEKHVFKNLPWTEALDANKPVGTKIIEVRKENEDTIIKYACSTKLELSEFMKSAHQLSGLNVNLLKYKVPTNGGLAEALIQITSKEDTVFKKK